MLDWLVALLTGVVIVQAPSVSGAPVTQVFVGGNATTLAITPGTVYSWPATISATAPVAAASENTAEALVLAGTLSELRVQLPASVGTATDSATFTLRKNGSSTGALTCTVVTGTSLCDSGAATQTVLDGDRLTMEITTVNSPVAQIPRWTWKWVGTNSNESMVMSSANMDGSTTTEYMDLAGRWLTTGTTGTVEIAAASTFTVSRMLARNQTAQAGSNCQRVTLMKNTLLETTLSVDLTGAVAVQSDTASVSFSPNVSPTAPDSLKIQVDPGASSCVSDAGSGTNGYILVTLGLTNSAQHFQQSLCGSIDPNVATSYTRPSGTAQWNTTEPNEDGVADAFTQLGFAFKGSVAPGAAASGKSYTYDFRIAGNGTGTAGCQVFETATFCTGTGSAAAADGNMVGLQAVGANTPAFPAAYCASWSGTGL